MDTIIDLNDYPEIRRRLKSYDVFEDIIDIILQNIWGFIPMEETANCVDSDERAELILKYLDSYMKECQ